jgi:hypothetical protein
MFGKAFAQDIDKLKVHSIIDLHNKTLLVPQHSTHMNRRYIATNKVKLPTKQRATKQLRPPQKIPRRRPKAQRNIHGAIVAAFPLAPPLLFLFTPSLRSLQGALFLSP